MGEDSARSTTTVHLPIGIVHNGWEDKAVSGLVTVKEVMLAEWLLNLCLLDLKLVTAVVIVGGEPEATITLTHDTGSHSTDTAQVTDDDLTVSMSQQTLQSWILYFMHRYQHAIPIGVDEEVHADFSIDQAGVRKVGELAVELISSYDEEPDNEPADEVERRILTLLREAHKPELVRAIQEAQKLLSRLHGLDHESLGDLNHDMQYVRESLEYVPRLIQVAKQTFGESATGDAEISSP